MTSFRSIIDEFGVQDLAQAFGVPDSHIRTMKARNSIPVEYWSFLVSLDRDGRARLTHEDLCAARAARFLPSPSQKDDAA